MQRFKTLSLAAALLALAPVVAHADKQEFTLPAITTFDGTHLGALTLGSTTASDVKGAFKIDKNGGNAIPWSLRLSTPKGGGYRVFVLFSGPGDKTAPLAGVLVQYESGPTMDMIAGDLNEQGSTYFKEERNSDWAIVDFADKGIIAFAKDLDHTPNAPGELFVSPAVLQAGPLDLSTSPTDIVPVPDPHARERRIMRFGNIEVNTYQLSGLKVRDDQKRDVKDDIELASAHGTINYELNGSGTYTVDFSGNYKWDKGGSVTVTVTISGMSPYGPVTAKGDSTSQIDKNQHVDDYNFYSDALHDARRKAERAFATVMRNLGPPTPDQARRTDWDDIFTMLRQQTLTAGRVTAIAPPAHPFTIFPN